MIIGNIGNLIKAYFESYYEIKTNQTENIKKLINIMKLKSFSKSNSNEDNEIIINDDRNLSDLSEPFINQRYIGKKDIFKIIDSMQLINQFNNDYNENYLTIIEKKIDNIKNMENINDMNLLKSIKEEKLIFENQLEEICEKGTDSDELNNVKNILLNDDSYEQKYTVWAINYLNKNRAILSVIDEKVYNSLKFLFEIMFDKLDKKKLFQTFDLAIILIQTFGKKEGNEKKLLEEEFKDNVIFKNTDIWINLIIQKCKDLFDKINEEAKDNKENKDNLDNAKYIKEIIEPILVSYIFTMKDFHIDNKTKREII